MCANAGFEVDELAFVVLKRDRETGMCRVVALNVQVYDRKRLKQFIVCILWTSLARSVYFCVISQAKNLK